MRQLLVKAGHAWLPEASQAFPAGLAGAYVMSRGRVAATSGVEKARGRPRTHQRNDRMLGRRLSPLVMLRACESCATRRQHYRLCHQKPWQPSQLSRLHPEGERVIGVEQATESLKGGRCPQVDRELLPFALRGPAANDVDVEAGELAGRPCGLVLALPQVSLPFRHDRLHLKLTGISRPIVSDNPTRTLMSPAMSASRVLIVFGLVLVALGILWPMIGKLGLGRLPGDIVIERENFRLYLPLVTSLLVSVVLSLVLWLFNR